MCVWLWYNNLKLWLESPSFLRDVRFCSMAMDVKGMRFSQQDLRVLSYVASGDTTKGTFSSGCWLWGVTVLFLGCLIVFTFLDRKINFWDTCHKSVVKYRKMQRITTLKNQNFYQTLPCVVIASIISKLFFSV